MIRRLRPLAPYLCLVLATIVMLALLKMPITRLDVPYLFFGDAIDKLAQIDTVRESGWLFHNDRLGYPFGYDRLDFPRFDSLNYAAMAPIAWLASPGLAMNAYFLASFFLIALAAFHAFGQLGLDTGIAFIGALVYAFLPYHVIRSVAHLTNGAYFLVPFAMLVVFWLADERFEDRVAVRRRWLLALLVALLVPLQMPYNGVFFAFLCLVALGVALARQWDVRSIVVAATLLAATGGAFVIEQIPVMLHAHAVGAPGAVAQRSPSEAVTYSMQLDQVLLPTTLDRRKPIANAMTSFVAATGIAQSETMNQYIGALGVFGFFALLWSMARGAVGRHGPTSAAVLAETPVRVAAMLAVAMIVLAATHGLDSAIAYWITAKIRAYNRILPFFAFACLVGAGWGLQAATRRIRSNAIRTGVVIAIGAFALSDVLIAPPIADREGDVAAWDRAHDYFAGVERALGNGAALFQLPVSWYPEHPPIGRMRDYEELKPLIFTTTLRLSYGVANGRSGYAWGKAIEGLPPAQIVEHARAMGFAAILVDASAYTDDARAALTDALSASLPAKPIVSTDRRWWAFPLDGCCNGLPLAKVAPGTGPRRFDYRIGDAPLTFAIGATGVLYGAGGWREPEAWGSWMDGADAALSMTLMPAPNGPIDIALDMTMLVGPLITQRRLRIEANGRVVARTDFTLETPEQTIRFTLPADAIDADGALSLRFHVNADASPLTAGIGPDPRSLGAGLVRLTIAPAERTR